MKLFARRLFMPGLLFAGAILAGCQSPEKDYFVSPSPQPRTFAGQPAAAQPPTVTQPPATAAGPETASDVARFRVGETVNVIMTTGSQGEESTIPSHEEPIKEDGTITMPLIGKIIVIGKTTGQLQNEIHELYVPKYYVRLTVTVKSPTDRVYYIGGQVNHPGVQAYLGDTTVTKAIQGAGDFTDFASHTVTLTRASGEHIKINVDKAKTGKAADPLVYPGDQIDVKRSIW